MKTAIKKLKLGFLLTGLVIFSSCGNNTAVSSDIGFILLNRTSPAITKTITKYSEIKIAEYLKGTSLVEKRNGVNFKKVEKPAGNPKAKPISISISREARLV